MDGACVTPSSRRKHLGDGEEEQREQREDGGKQGDSERLKPSVCPGC